MASWDEFELQAPALAALCFQRFKSTDLLMLGTLRKDGFPRISPIEWVIYEGELALGGIWQAKKALDLLRDPRCTIHSTTSNKDGKQGDAKLWGARRRWRNTASKATGSGFSNRPAGAPTGRRTSLRSISSQPRT